MPESDAQQAIALANAILDGSVPLILGCRRMLGPLRRLGVEMDVEFRLFVGVDSETDHLPVDPEERKLWNPKSLIEKDAEIEKYTAWARKLEFRAACEAVIRRFGKDGSSTAVRK
ncbi:MAG TPA: hypothetical protein VGG44_12040 [Tepidisphaeraceae bacterium]|jgi:hypothetical protein